MLRWALHGVWSAGQRRQSPPWGPQQWVQGPTPSQQPFLSHQAGDKTWTFVPRSLRLVATATFPGSYPSVLHHRCFLQSHDGLGASDLPTSDLPTDSTVEAV